MENEHPTENWIPPDKAKLKPEQKQGKNLSENKWAETKSKPQGKQGWNLSENKIEIGASGISKIAHHAL